MCGTLGKASSRALEPAGSWARHGGAILSHRGRDGEGFWTSPDGKAVLGHCRLSFIDLFDAVD